LGRSFTSAFEDAILSGEKFSNVLNSLERDIQAVFFRRLVTEPLDDFITGISKGILDKAGGGGEGGGGGGIIGKLFSFLPSFDVGSNFVPNDMIAKVHKGEMIVPAMDAKLLRQGGGTVFNIDARGASPGVEQAILRAMEMATDSSFNPSASQQRVKNFRDNREAAGRHG